MRLDRIYREKIPGPPAGAEELKPRLRRAAVGFGSNQGDPAAACLRAVARFREEPDVKVVAVSSLYRTEPVGFTEQDWFLNGVMLLETSLDAGALLERAQRIEQELGRIRRQRWGPRTIDLDLLFCGDEVLDLPELTLPHPRLHERRFVLVPLAEVAPDWKHPVLGQSVSDLAGKVPADGQQVRLWKRT
jgi:2-amino-4-hydroxy-6-hydroxymethyldihydropteridine diphosphokinase